MHTVLLSSKLTAQVSLCAMIPCWLLVLVAGPPETCRAQGRPASPAETPWLNSVEIVCHRILRGKCIHCLTAWVTELVGDYSYLCSWRPVDSVCDHSPCTRSKKSLWMHIACRFFIFGVKYCRAHGQNLKHSRIIFPLLYLLFSMPPIMNNSKCSVRNAGLALIASIPNY